MPKHFEYKVDSPLGTGLMVGAVVAALIVGAVFSVWGIVHSAASNVASVEAAEVLAALSSADPQTHFALGVRLDETFEPGSTEAAQAAFEKAVARSPQNYLLWMQLARAFEQNGHDDKAEAALTRALQLAPNYASVKWAIGNLIVRRGRLNEGFVHIREAVAADPAIAAPAAAVAWDLFKGDVASIRNAVGDSPGLNAALAVMLVNAERFEDAGAAWSNIPPEIARTELAEQRSRMFNALMAAHRYRTAALLADEEIHIGRLTNGDFEAPVKTDGATAFEWQIARGDAPLIAVSDNAPHGGRYALIAAFGRLNTSFRTILQLVAVEPGRRYTVTFRYRSEIEALRAELKWAVTEPVGGLRLGDSGALTPAGSWTARSFDFTVPSDAEGVRLEFIRENCEGPACTVSGSIWFDDFAMAAR